jgi:hypothetical protein
MAPKDTLANVDAAQRADALLDASIALRQELIKYERELRRARTRVLKGTPDPPPHVVPDLVAARRRLNERFDDLERCRRHWRVAFFRLQTDAGMSLGAIAREWGLSRQLISRLINDDDDSAERGTHERK